MQVFQSFPLVTGGGDICAIQSFPLKKINELKDINMPQALFPQKRHRRLRYSPVVREMVAETQLQLDDLILPLFVYHGSNVVNEMESMPGVCQYSVDQLLLKCTELEKLGINKILLFGIPEEKDDTGDTACRHNSIVQKAVRAIKEQFSSFYVIVDVCNCEYTTHGHCGTIVDGDVDNDLTLKTLAKQAVSLAQAGADMIAPSDMMDGRVGTIRSALDEAGFYKTPIMSYSVKYASAFYGPFREVAESAPQFGDRRTYQMDFRNRTEALSEAESDVLEGADVLMVKPAMTYLDIIADLKKNCKLPVAAYNVSGEYAMVKAAAQNGWIDGERVMIELLTSIKRAGADIIITYFAEEYARFLQP